MSVIVELRGSLEPIEIDMDFPDMVNMLNMASASGRMLAVCEQPDGKDVALAIPNILTIKESDAELFN